MTQSRKTARGEQKSVKPTPTHIQEKLLQELTLSLGPDHTEVKRVKKQIDDMKRGKI